MRVLAPACFVVLAAAATPAAATVVMVPTLEEMAITSDVIAEVRVIDQRVAREPASAGGSKIMTHTKFEVLDGWKGAKKGDHLELVQLGGELDGKDAWIIGARRFHVGDHAVIFAVRYARGEGLVLYGVGFGTFDIVPDPSGVLKDDAVVENVGDVVELDRSADGSASEHRPTVRKYASLTSFHDTVVAALALKAAPEVPLKHKLGPALRGAH